MLSLLASSFIDEARLRSHLGRDIGGAEENIEQRLTAACNRAIAWMETRTQRRLKARNYRTQGTATTSGSTAAGASTINLVSSSGMRQGDDLLCSGLDVGTQVLSVASGTSVTLTKQTLTTIASGSTLTYGSAPLTIDVPCAESSVWCPESPLLSANLFGLYWLDALGARTALSLTAVRVEERSGRVFLPQDVAPAGVLGLQFECRAGYEEPSATVLGHPNEWEALVGVQLRAAEVYFMDDSHLRGRLTNVSVGSVNMSAPDQRMPADIEEALRPFWRLAP